jgi:hypothetical protein
MKRTNIRATVTVLAVACCGIAIAQVDETYAAGMLQSEYWYGEAACPAPLPYYSCRHDFYVGRAQVYGMSAANYAAQNNYDLADTYNWVAGKLYEAADLINQ